MEPSVYDENGNLLGILDVYKSLIWTERYEKCGDFKIQTHVTPEAIDLLKVERILVLDESDTAMIIEDIQIGTDVESGNVITIKGRSIGSILDRRIIWNQIRLQSKIETAIHRLLGMHIINSSDTARRVPGFVFLPSGDPRMDEITVDKQFTGDNLLEAIESICESKHVGWRVYYNPNSETERYQFQLYLGTDRSYDQETLPFVIFSPNFDNLIDSRYKESKLLIKNVAHIKGIEQGSDRKSTTILLKEGEIPAGLNRRELYVDARDISQDSGEYDEEGNPILIPDSEYYEKLRERGREKLAECEDEKSFEGQAEVTDGLYIYGRDFFMGDIVQIENEFLMNDTVRVTELIRSMDNTGFKVYPTFMSTTKKEEEVQDT